MQGIPRRPDPRRPRLVRADDGFGLIEVMVSMVLLTALALATFALIDRSHAASATVRSKSVAAAIAHDDLNRMRQLKFSLASSASYQNKSSVKGIDGITYSVVSTAQWATDSGVETSCTTPTTAGTSAYLHIASTVTWPNMGTSTPVVADSILAPRGKEANRTAGSLMVKVMDRDAKAVPNAQVDVAGQSLATSPAGCVFFPEISAGQWPVTVSKAATPWNYMDSDGNSPGKATASVVVGDVSTVSVSFDIPAQFNPVTFSREDGTTGGAIKWTSFSIASQTKTQTFPAAVTNTPATAFATTPVFPFASGWSTYAGSCAGNNPSLYTTNAATALASTNFIPDRGSTVATGRAYLRTVTLTLSDSSISSNTAVRYYVRPYDNAADTTYTQMADCGTNFYGSADNLSGTATIPGTGTKSVNVPIDVPYGLYTICAENTSTSYSTNAYRWKTYTNGTAGNPTGAYHALPSATGITPKAGAPTNNTDAAALPLGRSGSPTTDQCA
jgi:prepilin-type N-terminal cleavage/methylation domain-containing protein